MRQPHHNRRPRGRGRRPQNPANRSYESSGPDVKIRGNPAMIAEKYITLSRDANVAGDRVAAENYLQHAEHYQRIVAASQAQQSEQAARAGQQRNPGQDARTDGDGNSNAGSDDDAGKSAKPKRAKRAADANGAAEPNGAADDAGSTAKEDGQPAAEPAGQEADAGDKVSEEADSS